MKIQKKEYENCDCVTLYGGNVRVFFGKLTKEDLEQAVIRFIKAVDKEQYEREQKEKSIRNQPKKMGGNTGNRRRSNFNYCIWIIWILRLIHGDVWKVLMNKDRWSLIMDELAELHYANSDPEFEPSEDDVIELNERASNYVANACKVAIAELSEEERESLKDDSDLLWDLITDYLWNN